MRTGTTPEAEARDGPALFAVFTEIAIIEHLSRNRLERALPDGLKTSHFGVLNHMVRLGDGRNPVELARAFQVQKGAMTNTLQRLEARGLVVLRPDPRDGRGKRVYLTDAGREAREACIAVALRIFAELDGGSLSEDLLAALPALRALRAALDRERDGARASARRSGSDDSES